VELKEKSFGLALGAELLKREFLWFFEKEWFGVCGPVIGGFVKGEFLRKWWKGVWWGGWWAGEKVLKVSSSERGSRIKGELINVRMR